MSLPVGLDPALSERLTLTLVHFVWQGSVVALLACLAGLTMRKATAQVRHGLYVFSLLAVAALPAATFWWVDAAGSPSTGFAAREAVDISRAVGERDGAGLAQAEPPGRSAMDDSSRPDDSLRARRHAGESEPTVGGKSAQGPTPAQPPLPIAARSPAAPELSEQAPAIGATRPEWTSGWQRHAPHAAAAYLIGVTIMLLRLLVGLRSGHRLRRLSTPAESEALLETLARQADRLRLRVAPAIAYCERVVTPTVVGLFRPMILLPFSMAGGMPLDQVEGLLAHELAHIRRGDHWVNLVQRLIEAVLFFHPAVWWVSRQIRIEREHCCDDLVLSGGGSAETYVMSLLKMAEPSLRTRASGLLVAESAAGDPRERVSQLRARIERMLSGRFRRDLRPATGRTFLVGLAALLAVGVVFSASRGQAGQENDELQVEGDPLDVRLIGVRPDLSDAILDANGKKIGEDPRWGRGGNLRWGAHETSFGSGGARSKTQPKMRRDFIFEVPKMDHSILLAMYHPVRLSGSDLPAGTGFAFLYYEMEDQSKAAALMLEGTSVSRRTWAFRSHSREGVLKTKKVIRRLLYLESTGHRKVPGRVVGVLQRDTPVERVDVTLRFWHGPRGPAAAAFSGPFRPGREIHADEDTAYRLVPTEPDAGQGGKAVFRLKTTRPTGGDIYSKRAVLAYDRNGERYETKGRGGSWGGDGADFTFSVPGLALKDIAFITFGEKPREKTFRNILVSYPDRPPRDYPEYLDKMAEALDLKDRSPRALCRLKIETFWDAVKVAEVARGDHLGQVHRQLSQPTINPKKMNTTERTRLRAAVGRLAQSKDPNYRAAAVNIAWNAGWANYVDIAFDLLDAKSSSARSTAARALMSFHKHLSAAQIRAIGERILAEDDRSFRRLIRPLGLIGRPAAAEVLVRLARDDRPWLWWPALCHYRTRRSLGDRDELPTEVRKRIMLVSGEGLDNETEDVRAAALEMLPQLLTVQVLTEDSKVFDDVLSRVTKLLDRDTATKAIVGFLRELREVGTLPGPLAMSRSLHYRADVWAVAKMVRYLNLWHGTNLGELGRDVSYWQLERLFRYVDWSGVVDDALQWSETGIDPALLPEDYEAKPNDLRVVWRNVDKPAESRVGVLRCPKDRQDAHRTILRWDGKDFVSLRVAHDPAEQSPRYVIQAWSGVLASHAGLTTTEVARSELPKRILSKIDTSGDKSEDALRWLQKRRDRWQGNWELWIEPLGATESVLDPATLRSALRRLTHHPTSRPSENRGIAWGKPYEGVRAGLELLSDRNVVLRESHVSLRVRLHLENISDHPINLGMCSVGQAVPGWFESFNGTGGVGKREEMREPTWSRRTMAPGQVFSFEEQALEFEVYRRQSGRPPLPKHVVRHLLSSQAGRRLLQYSLRFPPHHLQKTDAYKAFRREGDLEGRLTTGLQEVVLRLGDGEGEAKTPFEKTTGGGEAEPPEGGHPTTRKP